MFKIVWEAMASVLTFHAYCNVTVFLYSLSLPDCSIFGDEPDIKVGIFLCKAHWVSAVRTSKTHNNQFKNSLESHPQRPLFPSKPLNKRGKQTKTIQLWQDHLCGLPLGQMPDWPKVPHFYSPDTCQGFHKTLM